MSIVTGVCFNVIFLHYVLFFVVIEGLSDINCLTRLVPPSNNNDNVNNDNNNSVTMEVCVEESNNNSDVNNSSNLLRNIHRRINLNFDTLNTVLDSCCLVFGWFNMLDFLSIFSISIKVERFVYLIHLLLIIWNSIAVNIAIHSDEGQLIFYVISFIMVFLIVIVSFFFLAVNYSETPKFSIYLCKSVAVYASSTVGIYPVFCSVLYLLISCDKKAFFSLLCISAVLALFECFSYYMLKLKVRLCSKEFIHLYSLILKHIGGMIVAIDCTLLYSALVNYGNLSKTILMVVLVVLFKSILLSIISFRIGNLKQLFDMVDSVVNRHIDT